MKKRRYYGDIEWMNERRVNEEIKEKMKEPK